MNEYGNKTLGEVVESMSGDLTMNEYGNKTLGEVVESMSTEKRTLLYALVGTALTVPDWELSTILGRMVPFMRVIISKFTLEESEVLIFLMQQAQIRGRES